MGYKYKYFQMEKMEIIQDSDYAGIILPLLGFTYGDFLIPL
jgi:hypothetical protein